MREGSAKEYSQVTNKTIRIRQSADEKALSKMKAFKSC